VIVRAGLAATVAGLLLTGCGGPNAVLEPMSIPGGTETTPSTTPATTSPTAAALVDYTPLLLAPGDVYVPGDGYSAPPPIRDPDGVHGAEELMTNADQTRAIGITIVVLPDDPTAAAELTRAQQTLSTVVPTQPSQPVPVGTGAIAVTGLSRDSSKAVTALVFGEGRAIVRIDFYSAVGQPTPVDFAIGVGKMQALALRVGLTRPD